MDTKAEIEVKIKKLEQELNLEKARLNNIKKEERITQMKESLPPGFEIIFVRRRDPQFDNYYKLEHRRPGEDFVSYRVAIVNEEKGEEEAYKILTEYAKNIYNTTVYYANYLSKFEAINVLELAEIDCPWSRY